MFGLAIYIVVISENYRIYATQKNLFKKIR